MPTDRTLPIPTGPPRPTGHTTPASPPTASSKPKNWPAASNGSTWTGSFRLRSCEQWRRPVLSRKAIDEPVYLEPGLGEWQNADWFDGFAETLPPSKLTDRCKHVRQGHDACREPIFPESRHESLARLGATGQCLAERFSDETLLLVGHGMTVLGVPHGLIGSDVPDPGCPLASLTRVVHENGDWTIRTRNDTRHLENGTRATDRLA
jgi:broad specificity phosphatase PhoE